MTTFRSTSQFHPATLLVLWLGFLVVVQCLEGVWLGLPFMVLPLLGKPTLRRAWRLIWRTRWLLLSLFVIFSWGIAGDPLWEGVTSPTQEGLLQAMTHLGRLLLVLMAVACFLEVMPLPDLLSATHTLLDPLRRLGVDTDRGVVRLMLVLRYVETLPRPRDWRVLLKAPVNVGDEPLEVSEHALHWRDYLLVLGLILAGSVLVVAG